MSSQLLRLAATGLLLSFPLTAAGQPTPDVPAPAPDTPAPVDPRPINEPPAADPAPVAPEAIPPVVAEPAKAEPPKDDKKDEKKEHWYDKLAIRGYVQTRFNRVYASDDAFKSELGDKATADKNSFSLRRARLIVSGDVAPFLSVYLQTDASGAGVAMRDWYGDLFLTKDKTLRVRIGQSKVPYGWENMQSSQNRGPLDRSDPINSGAPGERDVGAFLYWEPKEVRALFKHLVDSGLKGSGDYGVLAFGVYNGQTLNVNDKNTNRHIVARATYPFRVGSQIVEVGVGGYFGKFNVTKDEDTLERNDYLDERAIASFVLYPKPIGFQAEYTIGKGPEFDLAEARVKVAKLHGGYAMLIGHYKDFFPFARVSYYDGGLKTFTDAPHSQVKELALGTEWQWGKSFELVGELDIANRRINGEALCDGSVDSTGKDVPADPGCYGAIFRIQAQFNY